MWPEVLAIVRLLSRLRLARYWNLPRAQNRPLGDPWRGLGPGEVEVLWGVYHPTFHLGSIWRADPARGRVMRYRPCVQAPETTGGPYAVRPARRAGYPLLGLPRRAARHRGAAGRKGSPNRNPLAFASLLRPGRGDSARSEGARVRGRAEHGHRAPRCEGR